ncbi:MAG: M50 family metallopeptidase [Ilumatobacter sp.]|uniref:M50 family metallopeptidase n=1 Tax=Ilumatobacter sp. TaxID=1967498 RepID=UPI00391A54BE
MTDQLTSPRNEPGSPPPLPPGSPLPAPLGLSRSDKMKSELMAGGAVNENGDDELAGGWRGALAMAGIAALFVWLATINIWWFVFVVGLVISIFLHEVGHFVTAKWTGMKATQFFLFFGPRLWSFRRGETEYGVRAIPAGAFVRIVGMNRMDDVEPGDEDRTYRQKSFPRRLLVISAGSIMHMIIAVLLLFVVYLGQGERTDTFEPGVSIAALSVNGPAQEAGLRVGDEFITVGGVDVAQTRDVFDVIGTFEPQEFVEVVVVRDGEPLTFDIGLGATPEGRALLGVVSGQERIYTQHGVPAAAYNAVTDIVPVSWESVQGVVRALNPVNIFTHLAGTNEDLQTRPTSVVGVTGVADDIGDIEGIYGVLWLLAVLNVFVGVFNMFPLLPLDGGHAAIAVYERVREAMRGGRQRYFADVERLMPFAMGVMVLLLGLFTAALYLDITDPL